MGKPNASVARDSPQRGSDPMWGIISLPGGNGWISASLMHNISSVTMDIDQSLRWYP